MLELIDLEKLRAQIAFLHALQDVGFFHPLRDRVRDARVDQGLKIVAGFATNYGIKDPWFVKTLELTVAFWLEYPSSPQAQLEPTSPCFLHPALPIVAKDPQLLRRLYAWPAPRPLRDHALWTALRFCGKPAVAIAQKYADWRYRDAEAAVEKAIARFARRIGLAIANHSRCADNALLHPYRQARLSKGRRSEAAQTLGEIVGKPDEKASKNRKTSRKSKRR